MAMIDFATARSTAIGKWFPALEVDLETAAVLFDELTEEHEWGWLFRWGPKDPSAVPDDRAIWGYRPILVDRMTGNSLVVGSGGMTLALHDLFKGREHMGPLQGSPSDG